MTQTVPHANEPLRRGIETRLDLEPLMVKAVDAEEGLGWSLDKAQRVAREYRRFLILCAENPDMPVVPSYLVDDIWHLHILDTAKYEHDCRQFLGYFLHHFPYFGMRGEQDRENLSSAWNETLSLYRSSFGEQADEALWPHSRRCPNCGRRGGKLSNSSDVYNEARPRLKDL